LWGVFLVPMVFGACFFFFFFDVILIRFHSYKIYNIA